MKKKKLFNPEGNDTLSERKIVGGNTTNLFNLNNTSFKWATKLYRVMMENFWIPEKVDLSMDSQDYSKLDEHEVRAFDGILSFLVFLDSIQTNNLPKISEYITAPEISLVLAIQTFQEAVHSQSYAYIIDTLIPSEKRSKIYDFWRDDEILFKRNKFIAQVYQDFHDNDSNENFLKVLVADYLLEAIYFYNGFCFFYSLASRNLMQGTADVIKYINRDELTHVLLFGNLIKGLKAEGAMLPDDFVYDMFDTAVKQEIEWAQHILGDEIIGINGKTTEQYTKQLANKRLTSLGYKPLYEGFDHNPYTQFEKIGDIHGHGDVRSNFFEGSVTSYNQSSSVDGWDEI
ncbi:MAG TPA: ribonucleotide-diphosphate reductase subunit beta [Fusobacteria bacterium]|nr:ribonucleotide-diphosphate reductase subunit beta [Fusobacteriota bacterium]|tara:strand:- start:613 stop:1644 length:1032 start_codon:yes stop_codon:yes gene_type:complete